MSDVDPKTVKKASMTIGLSQELTEKSLQVLPITTKQEFEGILSFLAVLSQALLDLILRNTTLDQRNDELISLTDELINLTEQLDRSLLTFKSFIDFSDVGAYVSDYYSGEIIMCNETYRRIFGIKRQEVEGEICFTLKGLNHSCPTCPKKHLMRTDSEPTEPYIWESYKEDTDQWFSVTTRALPWVDGRLVIISTLLDITARKKEEERIRFLAYHDQRFKMANCVKLLHDMNNEGTDSQLICLNIQGLRKINDAYGRDAGDCLLSAIIAWIKPLLERSDSMYRVEGGEFAVLLRSCSIDKALMIASKIHARFEMAWTIDMDGFKQSIYTGVHTGVIKAPKQMQDISDLFNMVERVLSFARSKGELILFDEQMNRNTEARLQLEIELKACVLNGMQGFYLYYQPIVEVSSERWVGLEALCRWDSPSTGSMGPDIFIPEIERLGLIDIVSNWVMRESLRQIKQWQLDRLPDFTLDVNLSPLQLRDRELVSKMVNLLREFDYPVQKFSLEITETSEVQFGRNTIQLLEGLRRAGISLSLDDFGSGYASFSSLNKLPIDCLKIDRSFITGIEEDPFLQQSLRSMLECARVAGLTTVAEGVETQSQLDTAFKYGVDRVQGYYYAMPLSTKDLEKKLACFDLSENASQCVSCKAKA